MSALIFDRTQADTDRAAYLIGKIQRREMLTEAEQAEYNAGLRGCYNITDLNRVEAKVRELAETLRSYGYSVDYTVPMKGASVLPSGYTELEYIESTGTQYIDTGVSAPEGCRVQCKVAYTSLSSTLAAVFGSHDAASPYYRNFFAATSSIWELGAYGTADFGSPTVNTEYEIDANTKSGEIACTVNGTAYSINQSIAPSAQRSALSVYLFAIHYADGLFPAKMKAWWYKVYVGGTLVRDFVPCKNPDGAVGLYDLVGGEFYTTPTAAGAVALPSGYTQLEYIQSSGTQYINTNFKPNGQSRIIMDCAPTSISSTFCFYCARSAPSATVSDTNTLFFASNAYREDYYGQSASTSGYYGANTRIVIDNNKGNIKIGNYSISNSPVSTLSPMPWILMASAKNSGSAVDTSSLGNYASMKLYSCKIYNNGTLVRNLVPAKNSGGTIGLYDLVNSAFYTNAGSGTFTAGADIAGFTAGADVSSHEDREWQYTDTMLESDVLLYLANIAALRDVIKLPPDVPPIPTADQWISWMAANDIERIVYELDRMIYGSVPLFRRCGTFRAGKNAQHLLLAKGVN